MRHLFHQVGPGKLLRSFAGQRLPNPRVENAVYTREGLDGLITMAAATHLGRYGSAACSSLLPISGPLQISQGALQLRKALPWRQQPLQQGTANRGQQRSKALDGCVQGLQTPEPGYHGSHTPLGVVLIQDDLHGISAHAPTQACCMQACQRALQVTNTWRQPKDSVMLSCILLESCDRRLH